MSYCRWSSDDFTSDVYVYAHVDGGWTTHIASRRHAADLSKLPPPVELLPDNVAAWVARNKELHAAIKAAGYVEIDHPEAGKTYSDPTPADCAARLIALKASGLVVPQYAIDELLSESTTPAQGEREEA